MATGQTLLNLMEVLDQELQLQSGEADVARALVALNAAQDYLEALLTVRPRIKGDTTGTITTSSSTETTAYPTGLLRLDRLQYLDPTTSKPVGPDLENLGYVGGHANVNVDIPAFLATIPGTGRPMGYWTNGRLIYWAPLPNATHTVRWYGLSAVTDVSAAGTFGYDDHVMLPLATFATKLMQLSVGDPVEDYTALAEQIFMPSLNAMAQFNQDRVPGYDYRWVHDA